jgi:hypothetical protein
MCLLLSFGLIASQVYPTSIAIAAPARTMVQLGYADPVGNKELYTISLPGKGQAHVYRNGRAEIVGSNGSVAHVAHLFQPPAPDASGTLNFPTKAELSTRLMHPQQYPFEPNRLIVLLQPGVRATSSLTKVPAATISMVARSHMSTLAPRYTTSSSLNNTLAALGVDRMERVLPQSTSLQPVTVNIGGLARQIDLSNIYRVHVAASSARAAAQRLARSSDVAYVSPDWRVATLEAPPKQVPAQAVQQARARAYAVRRSLSLSSPSGSALPTNYDLVSSGESALNAPGLDDAAAYDEIERTFHQLPGQGETITNVSIGDLDDASAATRNGDPCQFLAAYNGATTIMVGNQRYLNLPSLPLIPTYTADPSGNLNPSGEVCWTGEDNLYEVGLDFSVMAPLPDSQQRPGEQGTGLGDLLGIAPGAQYRLVVPAASVPSESDILGALFGAASQTPRPDVITTSIGFGMDAYGFSSRYLEDDPLAEALVTAIVQQYKIVVCIAGGDGTREATNAAIGPSGGSTRTDVAAPGGTITNINDVALSTAPSVDYDSGAIDAGGTTLDDLFAAPPQDPSLTSLSSQHAFAATGWTGTVAYASAFGSRLNLSAPADNLLALIHEPTGAPDSVLVVLSGGTSAAAPEAAAAAAVALQLGKLTGHPFASPLDVRNFLASTGTAVPNVPQADTNLQVGSQLNVRNLVESLLGRGGRSVAPAVNRVAVEQRRNFQNSWDTYFTSDTDSTNIDLLGPTDYYGKNSDAHQKSWITIAPDWEGLSAKARFQLFPANNPHNILATTRWARLLPKQILQAAGLPLASASSRTVNLTYSVSDGGTKLQKSVALTFSAADSDNEGVLAPLVPATVTGPTIHVVYDLSDVRNVSNPTLLVTEPGRSVPYTRGLVRALAFPLSSLKGSVDVPVSELQGAGIYGLTIQWGGFHYYAGTIPFYSDFAFTRVVNGASTHPPAPLLSTNGSTPGHILEIPYQSKFQVSWDVSSVPGATGAMLEISAAGPTLNWNENPFNNPNGSIQDNNGFDSGSVYYAPLAGTSGTTTVDPMAVGIIPTMEHVVRVIPTRNGVSAGEGSEVSTIAMDGVVPADGGSIDPGFGINRGSSDGLLATYLQGADGVWYGDVETFDQTTNQVLQVAGTNQGNGWYDTLGDGILGSDVGLVDRFDFLTQGSTYQLLNPVANGSISGSWTPPSPSYKILSLDGNTSSPNGLFLASDTASSQLAPYRLFSANPGAGTFGNVLDLSSPLAGFGIPGYWGGIAYDPAGNLGVLAGFDASNWCGNSPVFITADLNKSTVGRLAIPGIGIPLGVALDPSTHLAFVPTNCDAMLAIVNLNTNTLNEVPLPMQSAGYIQSGGWPAVDSQHGVIVLSQPFGPKVDDNNVLSDLIELDEHGNVLKYISRFNLTLQSSVFASESRIQLNPSTRTGYIEGPFEMQLEPFSY